MDQQPEAPNPPQIPVVEEPAAVEGPVVVNAGPEEREPRNDLGEASENAAKAAVAAVPAAGPALVPRGPRKSSVIAGAALGAAGGLKVASVVMAKGALLVPAGGAGVAVAVVTLPTAAALGAVGAVAGVGLILDSQWLLEALFPPTPRGSLSAAAPKPVMITPAELAVQQSSAPVRVAPEQAQMLGLLRRNPANYAAPEGVGVGEPRIPLAAMAENFMDGVAVRPGGAGAAVGRGSGEAGGGLFGGLMQRMGVLENPDNQQQQQAAAGIPLVQNWNEVRVNPQLIPDPKPVENGLLS